MTFKTLSGVLHPDGRVSLPTEEMPDHSVRVMVTLLEATEDHSLLELGDYSEKLAEYEERLARGEIQWQ